MAKEKYLTVMVPIKDADVTASFRTSTEFLQYIQRHGPDITTNSIYKVVSSYRRLKYNAATGGYSFGDVTEREFPFLGKPLEIVDFTYDAIRMGQAPTITAQGVKWYADKDSDGKDVTLDGLWTQEVFVRFNGEKFYLKQTPTCAKDNEDARYRYDIDFVSERVVLESVYFYDVVLPYVTERPISESSKFSFYGDVKELVKRINASMLHSGLASVAYKQGVTSDSFLTLEEFNAVGVGTYAGTKDTSDHYPIIPDGTGSFIHYTHDNIYEHFGGDYTKYLLNMVYDVQNAKTVHIGPTSGGYDEIYDGEYVITGYKCVIGKNAKGESISSEEKLISFDNNTIHEALQQIHDTFELQYYITREKDSNGDYTGNTLIMIDDCEYDFADIHGRDYVRDEDELPTSSHPFDYGVDKALLSKEKTNTTDKIVTRITGVGSSENIPWYYPNPTADGWIKPVYKVGGATSAVHVNYPTSEGTTVPESVRYEKYLKNRIGDVFCYGIVKNTIFNTSYKDMSGFGHYTDNPSQEFVGLIYSINVKTGYTSPKFTLSIGTIVGSNAGRIQARLHDNTANQDAGVYDSNETYSNPTSFQQAFMSGDSSVIVDVTAGHIYSLWITIDITEVPLSRLYDYSGYYYPSVTIQSITIPQGFYSTADLIPTVTNGWGYSLDGTGSTIQEPLPYVKGKRYKDVKTGIIYRCSRNVKLQSGDTVDFFTDNPRMDCAEWVSTFLNFALRIIDADGWYKNSKMVNLEDYGMAFDSSQWNPGALDTIEFQRVKYVTPQPNLMPEIYIKTDGARRYYSAHNYYDKDTASFFDGTADPATGEIQDGTTVRNPIYKREENGSDTTYYQFENEYIAAMPYEHIENFDNVKPTIKGQTNTYTDTSAQIERVFRIDVVEMFAYDELDNDEVWESNDGGNVSGEYKHPYFFAKLRPLGFNLFDLALQDDMVLSMTTGHCGSCNFKIGVDENTKKNPVQIWEYDVYRGNWTEREKIYSAGDIRRYVDTSDLYYDTDGTSDGYRLVESTLSKAGFLVQGEINIARRAAFERKVYTAEEVINGEVGSLKKDGKNHFDGDVMTSGKFIASQQDTSENFVWVALMKDTDTYGVLMPSARPDYGDGRLSTYIEPKGGVYTNRSTGVTEVLTDDEADKFVLTNIRLPQAYLRRAEHDLSRHLVAFMYDNNYQKFNFAVKMSRAFFAENDNVNEHLSEASVIYLSFDNKVHRQYIKHYSYRMSHDSPLPEIDIDTNEELNVSRTSVEQQAALEQKMASSNIRMLRKAVNDSESKISRRTFNRNEDVILNGNIVSRDASASLSELGTAGRNNKMILDETQIDLETKHFKKTDFVFGENEFSIGEDVHFSVPYKRGRVIERKTWNGTEFSTDSDESFAPAFIDPTTDKIVDYKVEDDVEVTNNTITPADRAKFGAFVTKVNSFNELCAPVINRIRKTVEKRMSQINPTYIGTKCDNMYTYTAGSSTYDFWLRTDGTEFDTSDKCPAGIIEVTWSNYNPN